MQKVSVLKKKKRRIYIPTATPAWSINDGPATLCVRSVNIHDKRFFFSFLKLKAVWLLLHSVQPSERSKGTRHMRLSKARKAKIVRFLQTWRFEKTKLCSWYSPSTHNNDLLLLDVIPSIYCSQYDALSDAAFALPHTIVLEKCTRSRASLTTSQLKSLSCKSPFHMRLHLHSRLHSHLKYCLSAVHTVTQCR